MNKIKLLIVSLAFAGGLAFLLPVPEVSAVNVFNEACRGAESTALCQGRSDSAESMVSPIISTLLYIIGIVAVVMIIIGGIMYTTSAGDPGKTKKAKDTILYSVIGLVVAVLAYAIVEFVVSRL